MLVFKNLWIASFCQITADMPRHYSLYLHICVFHSPNPLFFLALKKCDYFFITIIIIIMIIIMISSFLYYISILETIHKCSVIPTSPTKSRVLPNC